MKELKPESIKKAKDGDLIGVCFPLYCGADCNGADLWGCTPLIVASSLGRGEVVCELLKYNSLDVNASTLDVFTALLLASSGGHEELVSELVKHGPDSRVHASMRHS